MKKALFAGGVFAFLLLISPKLGFNDWNIYLKIAYDIGVAIISALLYIVLLCCRNCKTFAPLSTEEVRARAVNFRQNNHPGHYTLSNLVKLECIYDCEDAGRKIKKGQIVRARQVCERGRWHSRVRLRGGSYWLPVEYFKLAE